MEISVKLTLRSDASPIAIQQWLEWGKSLDIGLTELTAGEPIKWSGPPTEVAPPFPPVTLTEAQFNPDPNFVPASNHNPEPEQFAPDIGALAAAQAQTAPPAPAVEAPAPKKRGRKPSAATAAAQASALEADTADEQNPPLPFTPAAVANGFALPPGVSMPAAQPAPVAQVQQFAPPGALPPGIAAPSAPEPAAAMPKVEPAPAHTNGHMMLEDFKAEALQIQTVAQQCGKTHCFPWNMMRLTEKWPDGSPKPWATMMMDSVPAEDRRKLLDNCYMLLNQ